MSTADFISRSALAAVLLRWTLSQVGYRPEAYSTSGEPRCFASQVGYQPQAVFGTDLR